MTPRSEMLLVAYWTISSMFTLDKELVIPSAAIKNDENGC